MITIIAEAKKIPEGMHVRKVTGEKKYLLKHSVKMYGNPDGTKEISSVGIVFLVCDEGNINAYPDTHKFAVDLEDYRVDGFVRLLALDRNEKEEGK